MSVRDAIQDETTNFQEYIRKMAPIDDLLSECVVKNLYNICSNRLDSRETECFHLTGLSALKQCPFPLADKKIIQAVRTAL